MVRRAGLVVASLSGLVSTVAAHPGHGIELTAEGAAHRLASPYHWLEWILALAALGTGIAWLWVARRAASQRRSVADR